MRSSPVFIRRRERRDRRQHPRLKGLSLNKLLPNMLTMLALCAGLTAIRFGIDGRWEPAVVSIVIAGVFDGLDGRIARLLNATSRFGEELDSLSDVVSFGVAPALLIYLWAMREAGGLGWVAVLAFAVCCALRLARFNSMLGSDEKPPYAFNYFTGVPAPAGAGVVLLPLVITFQTGPGLVDHPLLVGLWTTGVGLLMVSRWPTFSLKGIRVPPRYVVLMLVGVGLVATSLVTNPWPTLTGMGLLYLGSLPFSLRQYHRLHREAQRLKTVAQAEEKRLSDDVRLAADER